MLKLPRHGVSQIYVLVSFPVMVAMTVIAVDAGRYYVARSELQTVADSAARYAAKGLTQSSTPLTTARANAAAVASESIVDGGTPTLVATDVVQGFYNTATKVFTADSTGDSVSVTVSQSLGRTGSAPLFVGIISPSKQKPIIATAIAKTVSTTTQIQPPAAGNLWLSGMPYNTVTQNYRSDNSAVWDNSGTATDPKQRPLEIDLQAAGLHSGDSISLEGLSGSASWQNTNSSATNTADGDSSYLVANGVAPASSLPTTSQNGMSNTRAPIGAIMAVFLGNNAPNQTSAPANLDFGTQAARDYSTISPQLKQVFFIGDGKRSSGESQTIVVPPGAKRVFFGFMDAWQWNDNSGNFKANLYSHTTIHLVK